MALSNEDKKDVSKAMGKAMARKVANVTKDFTSIKGRIFERTHKGGWEKVRGDVTEKDMKSYSRKHTVGQFKGQPMYRFRPNKDK